MTTQINAYLNFNGNCKEAMAFYQECLGGVLQSITMGESPMADQLPPEKKDHIMHSNLTREGVLLLMASDGMGSSVEGTNVVLSLNCSSEEEANTFFSKLSEGGKITHPLKVEFWGALFGQLTDKFGIHWMLNYDKN